MYLKNEKYQTPWYFWRIPQLQRILYHMPHHHYIFLCWQYAVVCELILTETDDLKSALTKFDKKILRSQSEAWEKQRVSMSASEKKGADDQQIDFKVRIKGEFLFVNFWGNWGGRCLIWALLGVGIWVPLGENSTYSLYWCRLWLGISKCMALGCPTLYVGQATSILKLMVRRSPLYSRVLLVVLNIISVFSVIDGV